MVKSALDRKFIFYPLNQSREITFVQDATDVAFKHIIERSNCMMNLTSKFHISLKDLAQCIKYAIEKTYPNYLNKIEIAMMPDLDTYIKNRGTVPLISTIDELDNFKEQLILHNTIKDIAEAL